MAVVPSPHRTLLCLALLLAAPAASAAAQPPPGDVPAPRPVNLPPEEDTHRLAILPVLDLTGDHAEAAARTTALLADGFARYQRLEVLAGEELSGRLKAAEGFQKDLDTARMLAELGQKAYERIQLGESIRLLEGAAGSFGSIHFELIAPREVARNLLTLAKAYLEHREDAKAEVKAELAFQRLLLADPSVRLLPGRFSDGVMALFERARYLTTQDRQAGLRTDQALEVAARVRADYVVSAALLPRPEAGSVLLAVQLLEVRRKMQAAPVQLVAAEELERLERSLDLLTSRLAACIPNDVWLARARNPQPFSSTLSFDTSYQETLFFQHPLQKTFQNMGLGSGVAWAPIEHLELLARLSFTTSRNDAPYQDLLDPVNLLRLVLGAGIAYNGPRLSIFSITGFDLTYPFGFRWTWNADCKFNKPPPEECNGGQVRTHDPGLLFGLHVGAGANWAFAPPLLLHFRSGLSYYFLPTQGNELNLPVDMELGLGYRF